MLPLLDDVCLVLGIHTLPKKEKGEPSCGCNTSESLTKNFLFNQQKAFSSAGAASEVNGITPTPHLPETFYLHCK